MRKIIYLILLFFQIGLLSAQELIFEKITTQQGLSQNDVNCIFQDHNGFLWIGTNDGLNRYDGYSFRTFRISQGNRKGEGLSSNLIFKVKEDKKGRLWIGTSNEGVCVFDVDKEIFTQIRNIAKNPIQLADNRVLDLECMADGTVWVATDKGVTIISEVNGNYETSNLITLANTPLVSKGCNVVSEDSQGRKWLGFYKGLVVCEELLSGMKITQIKEFEQVNVKSVLAVTNGLFVATDSGLFFLQEEGNNSNQWQLIQINKYPSSDIYLDEYQKLYASSNNKLLVYSCDFLHPKFKLKAEVNQGRSKSDLNSGLIMSVYGDSSGIVWIGTNGGGLNKYKPKRKKISHYRSTGRQGSLSCNNIRSIFEDSSNNVWIGTEGGGIDYLESSKSKKFGSGFKNYYSTDINVENSCYSIIETKNSSNENEIWVGAGFPQVLERFGKNGKRIPTNGENLISDIAASIFAMLKDRDGNIWLGTYGSAGLFKYELEGDTYRLTNFRAKGEIGNISSNIIRSLL